MHVITLQNSVDGLQNMSYSIASIAKLVCDFCYRSQLERHYPDSGGQGVKYPLSLDPREF